jgi:deoxyhypusine synthase
MLHWLYTKLEYTVGACPLKGAWLRTLAHCSFIANQLRWSNHTLDPIYRTQSLDILLTNRKDIMGKITDFIKHNYRHFNAAALVDAAEGYQKHLKNGGKMMVTLAGAMSTAELGLSLAEMIRKDKVHSISCTGANLEEDIFNLIAHDYYERVPNYRELSAQDEQALLDKHMNRVTDTCIPEMEAMRRLETALLNEWKKADKAKKQFFPHEFLYKLIKSGKLKKYYQIDPKNSWMVAAAEKNLPIVVPGWEDSTTGNMYAAHCLMGEIKNVHTVRSGIEYMMMLSNYYSKTAPKSSIGFFQIGGGIAGDFPICVVPMLHQDMQREDVPLWGYFCQISDSTTSFGSYSGAVPNEKITWGKLGIDTPKYIIESDATIVAPLMFAMILGQ